MWRIFIPRGTTLGTILGAGPELIEAPAPHSPVVAPPANLPQTSIDEVEKPFFKKPLFWIAVAGGVAVLGTGTALLVRRRRKAAPAAAPAPAAFADFGMTKTEAHREFNELYPPETFKRRGYIDRPMRNEAWNNFTDMLAKDRRITMKQYETWTHPWRD
jgi:hypothetical protein